MGLHNAAWLTLRPGQILGLVGHPGLGLTRLAFSLLSASHRPGPVALLDARGWLCPTAAWEAGLSPDRIVVVRCDDAVRWAQVVATLCEGIQVVYAEVPAGIKEPLLRRLGALVRSRGTALMLRPLRGDLPAGLSHLRLEARRVRWEGPDAGHGRLERRRLELVASGKAVGGVARVLEVEDDGAHTLRVVPRLAPAAAGYAAG